MCEESKVREKLKRCFPDGLVFGHHEIAAYTPKKYAESGVYPTGKRVDFDTAWDILGRAILEDMLENVSGILIRYPGDDFYYRALVKAVEGKE